MKSMLLIPCLILMLPGEAASQGMNRTSDNLEAHNGDVREAPVANLNTVNHYTPEQAAAARHAMEQAGYSPTAIEFAQAGNLFLTVAKAGQIFTATVTPDRTVYLSTGIPEGASLAANGR